MTTHYLESNNDTSAKFWEVSIDGPMLTISYGILGHPGEVSREIFEDRHSAQLAMETLLAEKLKIGFTQVKMRQELNDVISEPKIFSNRTLPKPERSIATPNVIHRVVILDVVTGDRNDGLSFLALIYETNDGFKVSVALDSPFPPSDIRGFPFPPSDILGFAGNLRFDKKVKNLAAANKELIKILKQPKYIKSYFDQDLVIVGKVPFDLHQDWGHRMEETDIRLLLKNKFSDTAFESSSVTLDTTFEFDSSAYEQTKIDVAEWHISGDGSASKSRPITLATAMHVAKRLRAGEIPDNWEACRNEDGTIDYSRVDSEALILLALARSEVVTYGYWGTFKQIIKDLERLDSHNHVLAHFYKTLEIAASYNSKERVNKEKKYKSCSWLEDLSFLYAFFGRKGPSVATLKYMSRRARRYLEWIKVQRSDSYVNMAFILLFGFNGRIHRSLPESWLTQSILYETVWSDKSHGRGMLVPSQKIRQSKLYLTNPAMFTQENKIPTLSTLFSKSGDADISTWCFQLLENTGVIPDIEARQAVICISSHYIPLRELARSAIEADLDRYVDALLQKHSPSSISIWTSDQVLEFATYLLLKDSNKIAFLGALSRYDGLSQGQLTDLLLRLISLTVAEENQDLFIVVSNFYVGLNMPRRPRLDGSLAIQMALAGVIFPQGYLTHVNPPNFSAQRWINKLKTVSTLTTYQIALLGEFLVREITNDHNIGYTSGLEQLLLQIQNDQHFKTFTQITLLLSSTMGTAMIESVAKYISVDINDVEKLVFFWKWSNKISDDRLLFAVLANSDLTASRVNQIKSQDFIEAVVSHEISLESLINGINALGSDEALSVITSNERIMTALVVGLTAEGVREPNGALVRLLLGVPQVLEPRIKVDHIFAVALCLSSDSGLSATGIALVVQLDLMDKIWVQLIESQLPIAMNAAKRYVRTLPTSELTDGVLVCLDSAVAATREFGQELLTSQAQQLEVDRVYVSLTEHSDSYTAALVAARALEPGIPDDEALDRFDRRQLFAIRQGRAAKELIKDRRMQEAVSGRLPSDEFVATVLELSNFGPSLDKDWAFELLSIIGNRSEQVSVLHSSRAGN